MGQADIFRLAVAAALVIVIIGAAAAFCWAAYTEKRNRP